VDDEQQSAVNYKGSVAVIAGPGSGKTHVLVEKAKIAPQNSIALTFTRNAAGEVKQRAPQVEASTIHSFCYKHIKSFPGDYDLLLHEFLSLKNKPKYNLVLVDEFQDLNMLEIKVIKSIIGENVFLVGDPFQSIFGYAHALGKTVLDYFEVKKLYLHNNYRSKKNIVRELECIHLRNLIPIGSKELNGTFVLFRTNRQLNEVAYSLSELGYDYGIKRKKGVFPGDIYEEGGSDLILMTIHCSKGLETKRVILFDWGERHFERNLEYVAIARASEDFHLINSLTNLTRLLGQPK